MQFVVPKSGNHIDCTENVKPFWEFFVFLKYANLHNLNFFFDFALTSL